MSERLLVPIGSGSGSSVCDFPLYAGFATVPDHSVAPRPDDGGSQWEWQVHSLEGAPQGPGAHGECGGCVSHHRP